MRQLQLFKSGVTSGLFWGLTGATILTALTRVHGNRPNHPLEIIGLCLFLTFILLAVFSLKIKSGDNKFLKTFLASFLTFFFVITSLYLYKFFMINPTFGFMWKNYFIMLGIGAALCILFTVLLMWNRKATPSKAARLTK